jgi:molybdopterin biosynthesis enzyme MoaB
MDTEKTSVAVLTKACGERDKQIEILQHQLDQATTDIELNLSIIDDLRNELNKGMCSLL